MNGIFLTSITDETAQVQKDYQADKEWTAEDANHFMSMIRTLNYQHGRKIDAIRQAHSLRRSL